MSVGFWSGAIVLGIVAILIVLWPFIRPKAPGVTIEQRKLNLTIYRQRMAELDQELASGLLNQEQHEAAKLELEDNLISDVGEQPETVKAAAPADPRKGIVLMAVVAAIVPLLAVLINLQLDTPMPGPGAQTAMAPAGAASQEGGGEHDMGEIERMVEQMEARLSDSPEDVESWVMLARTYAFMERHADAARAYERAHRISGDDVEINVGLAENLMLAAQGRVTPEAQDLLDRALDINPDHPNGIWLDAIGAYQAGDFDQAQAQLERLLVLVSSDPDTQRMVQEALEDLAATRDQHTGTVTARDPADTAPSPAEPVALGTASIKVNVDLDPAVASNLTGEETVMIFARPVNGSRMPLAVLRVPPEFPIQVTLDEGAAMIGGASMAQFEQVEVMARVSRSGMAMPESGDLEGEPIQVNPTAPGAEVSILIDRIRP